MTRSLSNLIANEVSRGDIQKIADRKHHVALPFIEQVRIKRLKRIFVRYLSIAVDSTCEKITLALSNDRSIARFDWFNCRIKFPFLKPDFLSLLSLLKFPLSSESFVLKDGRVSLDK